MTSVKHELIPTHLFDRLIEKLPAWADQHAPDSNLYGSLKGVIRREIEKLFSDPNPEPKPFGPFGELIFPYHRMGAIDSLNLFDLDEVIIFSFYWANRHRYRRVLDIGANIGLHSILLDRCGFDVRAYEPDPSHFDILVSRLAVNGSQRVRVFQKAVSSGNREAEFIRVLGNTTSSHLAGSKSHPYGELETCVVETQAIGPVMQWADLMKLDVEGHEAEILLSTGREDWNHTDAFVEVQSRRNAALILEHFEKIHVPLFSQKTNWCRVRDVSCMPRSYREGALFISLKDTMPWR